MGASQPNCFCAFCRHPRRIPKHRHVSLVHLLLVGAFSFFISYFVDGFVSGKALGIFVCLLGVIEMVLQVSWRMGINCPQCGFDPVLYTKDRKKACEKVKLHLESVQDSPLGLVRMQKFSEQRKVTPSRALKASSAGQRKAIGLSKEI